MDSSVLLLLLLLLLYYRQTTYKFYDKLFLFLYALGYLACIQHNHFSLSPSAKHIYSLFIHKRFWFSVLWIFWNAGGFAFGCVFSLPPSLNSDFRAFLFCWSCFGGGCCCRYFFALFHFCPSFSIYDERALTLFSLFYSVSWGVFLIVICAYFFCFPFSFFGGFALSAHSTVFDAVVFALDLKVRIFF